MKREPDSTPRSPAKVLTQLGKLLYPDPPEPEETSEEEDDDE